MICAGRPYTPHPLVQKTMFNLSVLVKYTYNYLTLRENEAVVTLQCIVSHTKKNIDIAVTHT